MASTPKKIVRRGTIAGGIDAGNDLEASGSLSAENYGSTGDSKETADSGSRSLTRPAGAKLLQRRQTFTEGEQHYKSKSSTWTIEDDEESMGDVSIIINLLADLSPAGALTLAAGMVGTGYIPSVGLLLLFATAAAYMMYLIAQTVEISGKKSFDKIWRDVVGERTAWLPSFVLILVCFGCCLTYACMFGDLFSGCAPAYGLTFASRTVCILMLSFFPLLPLCMLKDLSALAPTSFGALVATVWMVFVMVLRYFDGSYLPGGKYHGAPGEKGHVMTMGVSSLLLVNNLAGAFLCHYNGCKYYREYINHKPVKFRNKIYVAFGLVSCIFAACMLLGYASFGGSSDAVILNNYSKDDALANIARLGMGAANVFSFPLMFSGLRENTLAVLNMFFPAQANIFDLVLFQNTLSGAMLAMISLVAVIVTDASIVVGLVGSICGSAIIYVIPCFLFDRAVSVAQIQRNANEIILVRIIGSVGVILMVAGAIATLTL